MLILDLVAKDIEEEQGYQRQCVHDVNLTTAFEEEYHTSFQFLEHNDKMLFQYKDRHTKKK